MKVGILTLPLGHNYGGILQAWALQQTLKTLGYDVVLLHRKHKVSLSENFNLFLRRLYAKWIKKKAGVEIFRCEKNVTIKNTTRFINRNFRIVTTNDSYKKVIDDLDAIIVGSDQVWRPIYADGHLDDFFLKFTEGKKLKRIGYAASFGVDYPEYDSDEKSMASALLKNFDAVSVREKSGLTLCSNMLGFANAELMPDPTLLLDIDDYRQIYKKCECPDYFTKLFAYILDPNDNTREIVDKISGAMGQKPFTVHSKIDDLKAPLIERIHPPLEHWLLAIANSDFIITDSFHGCVFSIIFNKDFIVLGNKERGMARIRSLLNTFGLEDRMMDINDRYQDINYSHLDWQRINKIKSNLKHGGRKFLSDNLKD
ncbi:polysaccharide pyruvyl transferase family protein [Duncaniella muris]|nr:polysaccharide pyruvyl transferase family protein [Duncaniella muris]